MSLRLKTMLLVLPMVVLPLLVLGYFALRKVQSNAEASIKTESLNALTSAEQALMANIGGLQSNLSLIANAGVIKTFLSQTQIGEETAPGVYPAVLDYLANVAYANAAIYELSLLDAKGDPLAVFASSAYVVDSKNIAQSQYFQRIANAPQERFIQVADNPDTGERSLYASIRLAPTQQMRERGFPTSPGYVVITATPAFFQQMVDGVQVNNSGRLFFTDEQGHLLFSSKKAQGSEALPLSMKDVPPPIIEQIIRSAGQGVTVAIDNEPSFVFGAQILPELLLFVQTPVAEVRALTNHLSRLLWPMTLLFTLLTPLLLWRTIHRLLFLPVTQLTQAHASLSQGDWSAQIDHKRRDEFGQLFDGFNRMAANMAQSHQHMLRYNEKLEAEVRERTQNLRDVNIDLEYARLDAESASQTKSAFLANMSHEIRSPLTAIIGFSETMLERKLSDGQIMDMQRTVLRNAKHLLALINDILDLSKIEADKLLVEQRHCALTELIDAALAVARPLAERKKLSLRFDAIVPLPMMVVTDSTRLQQVLINLLSNAIKFTERGEVVLTLRWLEAEQGLVLEVSDTGIGISVEQMARLFQPFTQADVSTTRTYGGTGLGLYIAQKMIHLLGGDIQAASVVGKGSRFTIWLPFQHPPEQWLAQWPQYIQVHAGTDNRAAPATRLHGTVLVADDNADNRALMVWLLEDFGLSVLCAQNGRQAVEQSLVADPDLIFMDMQMPELDGMAAIKLLKASGNAAPVVAFTASAMRHEAEQYLAAGCIDLLSKPIDRERLRTILCQHLLAAEPELPAYHGNLEFQKLQARYLLNLGPQLQALEDYANAQDWVALTKLLHELKGCAGSFALPELSKLATDAEHVVLRQHLPSLLTLLAQMRMVFDTESSRCQQSMDIGEGE